VVSLGGPGQVPLCWMQRSNLGSGVGACNMVWGFGVCGGFKVLFYYQVGTPRDELLVSWPFLHMRSYPGGIIQPVSECRVWELRWILGESTRLRTKLEF